MSLKDFADDSSHQTIAEAIGHMYKGEIVQIYWSESGGSTRYSDFDVNSNMYVEGKVLWGQGSVVALECEVVTPAKTFTKEVLFNSWQITFVTKKDNINLTLLLKGRP